MYFNDRTALGKTLAGNLRKLRKKDAVVLCLKERSLLTALTVAMDLRAWVYPLLYEPVYTSDSARTLLGAFDEDGTFCLLPHTGNVEETKQALGGAALIEAEKPAALASIQDQAARYEMTFNKHCMDGRPVILVADVITDPLPIIVAAELLNKLRPSDIRVAVGVATPETAAMLHAMAEKPVILDVISGVIQDDDHYFEHTDAYSSDQKYTLTQHITTYWH